MSEFKDAFQRINETTNLIRNAARKVNSINFTVQTPAAKATRKAMEFSSQLASFKTHIGLIQSLDRIAEGFSETEEDIVIFKKAMVDLGYPPHDQISIKMMRSIAGDYKQNGKKHVEEYIDEFMLYFFTPKVIQEKIAFKWEKYDFLNKRLPLLRNAVKAHNLGMYELVIPSILSQFEGIIVDAFGVRGRVNGKIQKILYETLLIKEDLSGFHFDYEIHEYYSNKILVEFAHGEEVKSEISRHAILHGGDTNFGTETNSLKVILLFDFIANSINELDVSTIKLGKSRVENPCHQP
ncbi:hypothetical protein LS684_21150 (plasmid) [Cytobacillus spongiae]|uniref:hypothetical protein n=1 Tax=Cytobacillus spongiae TaxID=2901381 RepID=UPI001F2433D9|nr:hypothetical protein [Cytobacillus spongiae]UII58132.1 hypothetical protein LS684_21150 [Cytobacillus spongiae]